MSRVEEALRRAGTLPAPVERLDLAGGRLQHYAGEARVALFSTTAVPAAADIFPTPPRPLPTGPITTLRPLESALASKTVVGNAPAMLVEQFRRLAVAVHELHTEQGLRLLLITSALPGEGKTLTAINLALTLSESCERRVLLVDADVRRPFIHRVFNLPNDHGLTFALTAGEQDFASVQVSENLSVVPAGDCTQPMALASDRLGPLLDRAASNFDVVLIDAAPVGVMPDAKLLARLTKAVLFVIEAHTTPQALVSRAIADVGQELVIGTVLNGVEEHDIPAAGYYNDYTRLPMTDQADAP